MGVVYILLLIQGITVEMVLYQAQNVVSVEVNRTAVITCVSSERLESGLEISWYYRKWGGSEALVLVKSCSRNNDPHRYVCKYKKYMACLEVNNAQFNDSGVYYCKYRYVSFGNGTNLNVGDKSMSRSSIYILGHLQPLYPKRSLHLACVVLASHHLVYLYWNISGTYYKGQIISKEESDRTWTVMNLISIAKDNWNHGKRVTCEVWIKSSPTSVNWEIPGQDEFHGKNASKCGHFITPVVTAGSLLVLTLLMYLRRKIKLPDNNAHKEPEMEDEINYSELNINALTRFKNQPKP